MSDPIEDYTPVDDQTGAEAELVDQDQLPLDWTGPTNGASDSEVQPDPLPGPADHSDDDDDDS